MKLSQQQSALSLHTCTYFKRRLLVRMLLSSRLRTFEMSDYFLFNDACTAMVDRDSSVGIATRYGLDGPWIESRLGARFSAPVHTGPGAYPAFCTMGTGSFSGVKRPGRGADHPPLSKCRGHEREGLYLYSPSGPHWHVVGRTFM